MRRRPREFLSNQQVNALRLIHDMANDFYKDNDNCYTYALAGLLCELTKTDYIHPPYVVEKLNIILRKLGLPFRANLTEVIKE